MDSKNIKGLWGCYISDQMESAPVNSQVKIAGANLCLTQTQGVGAGQIYKEYDYTGTRGDGFFFTLQYIVHTSNGCGAYEGTPNFQDCNDFMANYDTIIMKPIQDSVATLQFTK